MMKKIITLSLIMFILAGCASNTETLPQEYKPSTVVEKQQVHYTSPIASEDGKMILPLNTNCGIISTDSSKKDVMSNTFDEEIIFYHKLLDPSNSFDGINNVKTINDNYGKDKVIVDQTIIDILKEAINLSKLTLGYFNPTVGVISNIWKDKFNAEHTNTDPAKEEIEEARKCSIPYELLEEYIIIDDENNTVEFKQYENCENIIIDLGAFSKGYVLDKVYERLLEYKCGFLIVAGGSSIVTYVEPTQTSLSWVIGENNPDNTSDSIYNLKLNTSFISTSGDYEQYYINEDGVRRHHIINPYTGYSESNYRSISIVSDKYAGIIDGLTTALFNLPEDKIDEVIANVEKEYNFDIKKSLITGTLNNFTATCDQEYNDLISSSYIKDIVIAK